MDEVLEDGGLRLGSALDSAFGQSGDSSPEACALLQGCCPQGTSAGTPGARGQGCPAAECRCSTWYGRHEKMCVGARSAQRVFPAVGNQEGSFWAETKDKHLKSIHRPASAPGRVCTYGHTSRQKERLCAYTHTPHLCLRHPPVFFFSRQGFHELQ